MRYKYHLALALLFGLWLIIFIVPVKASTDEIDPIMDAEVSEYTPNDNSGSSNYLEIGADIFGYQQETYLKFSLPEYSTELIRVYIDTYWYSFMCETPLSVSACQVSNSWSEYTITWNNRPSHGADIATETTLVDGDHFAFIIPLDMLTEGADFSVCIYENTPYKPDGLQGNSREAGYRVPKMVIEYEVPPLEIMLYVIIGIIVVSTVGLIIFAVVQQKRRGRKSSLPNTAHPQPAQQTSVTTGSGFCPNCGRPRSPDSQFCMQCGHKF